MIMIIAGISTAGTSKISNEKSKSTDMERQTNTLPMITIGTNQKGFIPLKDQKAEASAERTNHKNTIENAYANPSPGSIKRYPIRNPTIPAARMHSDNRKCILLFFMQVCSLVSDVWLVSLLGILLLLSIKHSLAHIYCIFKKI